MIHGTQKPEQPQQIHTQQQTIVSVAGAAFKVFAVELAPATRQAISQGLEMGVRAAEVRGVEAESAR